MCRAAGRRDRFAYRPHRRQPAAGAGQHPAGGAWLPGDDAYLSLAQAWLGHQDPERAQAILAPLLAVAERAPWTATLAAALVTEADALHALGETDRAAANLLRAAGLAREHGLPHVLSDARAAQRSPR